jgi:NADPH:quinone reductase-like Zn-dependent oxidoreductase
MRAAVTVERATAVELMTGVGRHVYGGLEVLHLEHAARPVPGANEVLVRVRAAGVARSAWHLMTGLPYLVRVAGFGVRRPKRPLLGSEFAGVVEAVGSGVTRFKPGDEVYGSGDGAFAEYVVARDDRLSPKPASLTFEEAAAIPESGSTAMQAVRDKGRVQVGQRVLVIGASGGVGSYAVQIAKALGAEVTGVSSTSKVDLVRALGADHVVDYTTGEFAEPGVAYDLILDIGGSRPLSVLIPHLTENGTLVIVGGEGGGKVVGAVSRSLNAMFMAPFTKRKIVTFIALVRREDLEFLSGLVEAGQLRSTVEKVYPLSETAEALRQLEAGRVRGKVVVAVTGT